MYCGLIMDKYCEKIQIAVQHSIHDKKTIENETTTRAFILN